MMRDILLDAPWWVSIVLAFGSYIVFYAIVPAVFAPAPLLSGLALVSRSFAWIPATMFAFLGLLAFLRARKRSLEMGVDTGKVTRLQNSGNRRGVRAHASGPDVSFGNTGKTASGASTAHEEAVLVRPTEWTVEALRQLEWKRFEMLCVWYYEAMGFTVKTVPHGADGGIDATLYKSGAVDPVAIVQCKAWRSPVKVEPVRALGGVMLSNKVKRGVFWSLFGFVGKPVQNYAADAGIQLLDGTGIIERISALAADQQATLLARAFEGDYQTPTCAACGVKLVERQGKGGSFWGCRNYSKGCRVRLPRAG